MAKKKKQEDVKPGSPAWMATFSDLMNLLLCFFVLLFSMSSVDAAKYEEVVNSFAETFSVFSGGGSSIGDGVMVSNGVSQLNNLSVLANTMGKAQEGSEDNSEADNNSDASVSSDNVSGEEAKAALEEEQLKASEKLAEEIEEALEETIYGKEIDIDFTSQYVSLTMNGALLFDSGSATIKKDSLPLVEQVGKILERYAPNVIEVEGHTDNVPIRNANFADNDELSDARALSIFRNLLEMTNIDPALIKHSGRGEYVPIADNSTPEGRAKNRRVEIKIYNSLSDAAT
ncbi:chemotaxis protein MotB [Lachnospiraceae bacterium KH1T2]|nr:chemotaxis protein MotB [Lachnospiraceae bacterium KH1T2]